MGASVTESVPVGRPTTEEPFLGRGLRGHGVAHPRSDAGALTLAHAAEERHEHVVSFGPRIGATADFGHPQLDAVVLEQREGQGELRPVEGALRLADGDGLETTIG